MSSVNLKGSCTKNSSFFQRGLGCLKRSWLSAHSFNNFSWISSYPARASAKEKSFGTEQNGLKSFLCFNPFAEIESFWLWTIISIPIRMSLSGSSDPMTFVHVTQLGKNLIPILDLVTRVVLKTSPLAALKR